VAAAAAMATVAGMAEGTAAPVTWVGVQGVQGALAAISGAWVAAERAQSAASLSE
jgi:hypothetical protein